MSPHSISAIIPAAGIGQRFPGQCPKQYLSLAGSTVIEQTLQVLLQQKLIQKIIVVLRPGDERFTKFSVACHPRIQIAFGGERRVDSVLNGLQLLSAGGWVLVHDAVRPCLHPNDLEQLLASCHHPEGAILATPVRNSLKRADSQSRIIESASRENLWQALTPQLFPVALLKCCLQQAEAAKVEITDEAVAMTYCGYRPLLVHGRSDNIKITYPEDLILAACLLTQLRG